MHAAIGVPYPVVVWAVRLAIRIGGVDRANTEQSFKAADDPAESSADNCSDRPGCVHAD